MGVILHDRIGRLEIGKYGGFIIRRLHDRIGRLEMAVQQRFLSVRLHDRIGRLEMVADHQTQSDNFTTA